MQDQSGVPSSLLEGIERLYLVRSGYRIGHLLRKPGTIAITLAELYNLYLHFTAAVGFIQIITKPAHIEIHQLLRVACSATASLPLPRIAELSSGV